MVREPPRKCSFCGHHGHNSRTCTSNNVASKPHCVKLFGVTISDEQAADPMKKSRSMGNLLLNEASTSPDESGYLSDGLIHNKRQKAEHERKKGKPWTEEEHRTFLFGLNELGKGDWRGISQKFVPSRTPTQVASHAQKYFLRKFAPNGRKKRRSSLFDMPYNSHDDSAEASPRKISGGENQQVASRPQLVPGNISAEITKRFPHMCLLDNYPVPILPAPPRPIHIAPPNYQPIPYPYHSVGGLGMNKMGHQWRMPMMSYGPPSYMYNVNVPTGANGYVPMMVVPHPSGIPPPKSPSAEQVATPTAATQTDKAGDGLELRIALPQSKPSSSSTSPTAGAIKVT